MTDLAEPGHWSAQHGGRSRQRFEADSLLAQAGKRRWPRWWQPARLLSLMAILTITCLITSGIFLREAIFLRLHDVDGEQTFIDDGRMWGVNVRNGRTGV